MNELRALEAQFAELDALLGELVPADWDRQTRCEPMSVLELVAHIANVLPFWRSFLEKTPEPPPTTNRVQWWRYDAAAESPKILARAQKLAEGKTPDDVLSQWRAGSEALLTAYRAEDPERLVGRAHLSMPLNDLVTVGVVEVGVHTMDLGHATLKGERLAPEAQPLVVEVLEGLAGTAMPAEIGWTPRTFILCATGRRAISPTERHVLGALADTFPLLS